MKRFLIAAVLAASTLGMTGAAMAAFVGEDVRTRGTAATMTAGSSDDSFIKQQNQQYNQDPGE